MSAGILHTAVSIEAICYERLEHVESWTWSPLGNHVTCTLDRQESDVSKLLVETSNLVIMKPCLVLSGCLRTTFSSLVVLSASGCSFGEKFYFVCNLS